MGTMLGKKDGLSIQNLCGALVSVQNSPKNEPSGSADPYVQLQVFENLERRNTFVKVLH